MSTPLLLTKASLYDLIWEIPDERAFLIHYPNSGVMVHIADLVIKRCEGGEILSKVVKEVDRKGN